MIVYFVKIPKINGFSRIIYINNIIYMYVHPISLCLLLPLSLSHAQPQQPYSHLTPLAHFLPHLPQLERLRSTLTQAPPQHRSQKPHLRPQRPQLLRSPSTFRQCFLQQQRRLAPLSADTPLHTFRLYVFASQLVPFLMITFFFALEVVKNLLILRPPALVVVVLVGIESRTQQSVPASSSSSSHETAVWECVTSSRNSRSGRMVMNLIIRVLAIVGEVCSSSSRCQGMDQSEMIVGEFK